MLVYMRQLVKHNRVERGKVGWALVLVALGVYACYNLEVMARGVGVGVVENFTKKHRLFFIFLLTLYLVVLYLE